MKKRAFLRPSRRDGRWSSPSWACSTDFNLRHLRDDALRVYALGVAQGVWRSLWCRAGVVSPLAALLADTPSLRRVRGQIKMSLLLPHTHIRPHTGPRDDRLRLHCTIAAPPNAAKLRVGPEEWRRYNDTDAAHDDEEEEECFVFDESCEHEVVFGEADQPRIVLIVDFVNPFLSQNG